MTHAVSRRPPAGPPQPTEFNTCVFKLEIKNPSDPADMPDPMPRGTSYAAGPRRTMNVFRYIYIYMHASFFMFLLILLFLFLFCSFVRSVCFVVVDLLYCIVFIVLYYFVFYCIFFCFCLCTSCFFVFFLCFLL